MSAYVCQHTSAYVGYVSVRQQTSADVSICQHTSPVGMPTAHRAQHTGSLPPAVRPPAQVMQKIRILIYSYTTILAYFYTYAEHARALIVHQQTLGYAGDWPDPHTHTHTNTHTHTHTHGMHPHAHTLTQCTRGNPQTQNT